jgi:hypothetical protein
MEEARSARPLTRRSALKLGALGVAGSLAGVRDLAAPIPAIAQTPKRGGVFRFPGFDPPHFDPHQSVPGGVHEHLGPRILRCRAGRHRAVDVVQAVIAQWKKAGIDAELKLKEGNAFIASVLGRKFEKLAMTLRGGPPIPIRTW